MVWMMLVLRKPALTLAIRKPRKDAISIGMRGRSNESTSHRGYTTAEGRAKIP